MEEFFKENWISIAALILSAISLYLTYKGWQRSRSIFDIEEVIWFKRPNETNNNVKLRKKLSSGNYTILHTEKLPPDLKIVLGKLKKR
ncbi:hypothetical protein HY604_04105 [Candidatus Peregrinibacteria bacterium]|nr:hypothetical protein [Candidatus Peregrinibacteria bacterium]